MDKIFKKSVQMATKLNINNLDQRRDFQEFLEKLEFVKNTGRYSRLLKDYYSCNDSNNLESIIFEIHFAYVFESANLPLKYEVKQDGRKGSVDFLRESDCGKRIYFELHNAQELLEIKKSISDQINSQPFYAVGLDFQGERSQVLHVKSKIESKISKYSSTADNIYNVVVANIAET